MGIMARRRQTKIMNQEKAVAQRTAPKLVVEVPPPVEVPPVEPVPAPKVAPEADPEDKPAAVLVSKSKHKERTNESLSNRKS
jgi:hypothetical protein